MRFFLLLLSALAFAITPVVAQNPSAPATDGQVSLAAGFSPDPYTVPVGAGGPVDVDVAGCGFGFVSSAPDFKLSYSASGGETLVISATSDDDTTLLVNLPDGSWACDDDGGDNTNPRLAIPNASSGRYDIWVGTYRQREGVRAALSFSDSRSSGPSTPPSMGGALNPSAPATDGQVSLAAGFSPDPYTVPVGAGGPVDVDVAGCGFGFVSSAPDFKLSYSASGGETLVISATSSDDTTLLVNLPDGSWACDDDGGDNTNPRLAIPNASSGRYDIWVGTYRQAEGVRAALSFSDSRSSGTASGPSSSPTTSGALNPSAPATDGQVSLAAGFSPDPYTVPVGAGGPVDVDVAGCGFGFVSSAPDFKLSYSASGGETLVISATSSDDTTLLVNLPDGSWACDDDGGDNTNPRLAIPNASSGRYDIWVGTYRQVEGVRAALSFSDSRSSGAVTSAPGATTVAASWTTQADRYRGQNGTRYLVTCPAGGTTSSRLWGSNPYTDDSSICTAGVHAGVITSSGGGQMLIEIRPGQSSYASTTSHGLTSRSYGSWGGSFLIIR